MVKKQGPITFSSASDWCKATALNDSTVQVSVDNNETNSGRSSLLTIKSGVDSVNVTVQQQGFYFQGDMGTAISLANGASREAFALNTNGKTLPTLLLSIMMKMEPMLSSKMMVHGLIT